MPIELLQLVVAAIGFIVIPVAGMQIKMWSDVQGQKAKVAALEKALEAYQPLQADVQVLKKETGELGKLWDSLKHLQEQVQSVREAVIRIESKLDKG